MNELQEKYGPEYANRTHPDKLHCHLQVFGFPSNQFGYQEPAENFELMNCLKYVRPGYGFVPNFPLSGKLQVNGRDESPVFTFLKSRCSAPMGLIANRTDIIWSPIRNNDISWNFAKWLVKSDGHPYKRYTSRTTPQSVEEDIVMLLNECAQGKNSTADVSRKSCPSANPTPLSSVQSASPMSQAYFQVPSKQKRHAHHSHDQLGN